MTYRAPVADISFSLNHAAGFAQALADDLYGDLSGDVVEAVLAEAGKFATDILAPLNVIGDREGAHFHDGAVTTAPGWKEAYHAWAKSGWNALAAPAQWGGQELPHALNAACLEMWNSAAMALIRAITPVSADKIYDIICQGPRGLRPRQGEKAVALCRRAWRVFHRLYPSQFDRDVPNPWEGVTKHRRTKGVKPAATRDQVYTFAWGCIEHGQPEAAAAAVICFEWLQRPENVLAGYLRWTDYRSKEWPNAIKIEHHKTGAVVWHPLEEETGAGLVRFYEDAEAVLAKVPRRGVPMILRQVRDGITKPFSFSGMQKIVHTMRGKLGLPATFTLDACRHGGMTELEEAELTDGQGRALSAHKSQQAYAGYAKRTIKRALAATRKRHAHALANAARTNIQNERQNDIQNADPEKSTKAGK